MSKKDYIMIAKEISGVIKDRKPTLAEYATIRSFSLAFQKDNPRFDEARFIKACLINSKTNE